MPRFASSDNQSLCLLCDSTLAYVSQVIESIPHALDSARAICHAIKMTSHRFSCPSRARRGVTLTIDAITACACARCGCRPSGHLSHTLPYSNQHMLFRKKGLPNFNPLAFACCCGLLFQHSGCLAHLELSPFRKKTARPQSSSRRRLRAHTHKQQQRLHAHARTKRSLHAAAHRARSHDLAASAHTQHTTHNRQHIQA